MRSLIQTLSFCIGLALALKTEGSHKHPIKTLSETE